MTFPNASSGVKKVFIAEILQLIATLLLLVTGALGIGAAGAAMGGSEAGTVGFGIGALVGGLGSVVILIIAYIMNILGLFQASKDEPTYLRYAFIATIAGLVISLIASFLSSANPDIAGLLNSINGVVTLLIFFFTIIGIGILAQKLGRNDIFSLGNKVQWIIAIVIVIGVILRFVGGTAGGILAIASLVMTLVAYIMFLLYLSKANRMLQES